MRATASFAEDGIRGSPDGEGGVLAQQADNPYNALTMRGTGAYVMTERGVGVSALNPMQMVGMAFAQHSDFGNILLDGGKQGHSAGLGRKPRKPTNSGRKGQLSDF
ncbi:hypothetical protein KCP73_04890 [Salmonella enterica subsp. enterica]|nr:hypothetical protein KCP73_04890 [Salmonella enterica subsp. enterica]